jgi:hypothetical protein
MPLTHGSQELSKARALLESCPTAASVLINDDDLPKSQGAGTVRSGILAPLTLLVVTDVMVARLADRDGRGAGQMRWTNLLTHGEAPCSVRRAPTP